jgi:hypothetical protein
MVNLSRVFLGRLRSCSLVAAAVALKQAFGEGRGQAAARARRAVVQFQGRSS